MEEEKSSPSDWKQIYQSSPSKWLHLSIFWVIYSWNIFIAWRHLTQEVVSPYSVYMEKIERTTIFSSSLASFALTCLARFTCFNEANGVANFPIIAGMTALHLVATIVYTSLLMAVQLFDIVDFLKIAAKEWSPSELVAYFAGTGYILIYFGFLVKSTGLLSGGLLKKTCTYCKCKSLDKVDEKKKKEVEIDCPHVVKRIIRSK